MRAFEADNGEYERPRGQGQHRAHVGALRVIPSCVRFGFGAGVEELGLEGNQVRL